MSLPVVLRDEAQAEFDEAFDYYETQRAGRSVDFGHVCRTYSIASLRTPEFHATVLSDVRKTVVSRFPYCVYYRADAARVEIIAVFHTSRDPSIWQARR